MKLAYFKSHMPYAIFQMKYGVWHMGCYLRSALSMSASKSLAIWPVIMATGP
jgi:hypothetical protein